MGKEIKALPGEPIFTFRAKDDLAVDVVLGYRKLLLEKGYAEDSDMIKSINEWVEQACEWREKNCDACHLPNF